MTKKNKNVKTNVELSQNFDDKIFLETFSLSLPPLLCVMFCPKKIFYSSSTVFSFCEFQIHVFFFIIKNLLEDLTHFIFLLSLSVSVTHNLVCLKCLKICQNIFMYPYFFHEILLVFISPTTNNKRR